MGTYQIMQICIVPVKGIFFTKPREHKADNINSRENKTYIKFIRR